MKQLSHGAIYPDFEYDHGGIEVTELFGNTARIAWLEACEGTLDPAYVPNLTSNGWSDTQPSDLI
jgi:hypothetical protein